MKKVLFAVGLMLALSAGVVYSSEVHFNSQQEPDEQVSMTDHSGFFGCAWRIMRGRWVCLPAG